MAVILQWFRRFALLRTCVRFFTQAFGQYLTHTNKRTFFVILKQVYIANSSNYYYLWWRLQNMKLECKHVWLTRDCICVQQGVSQLLCWVQQHGGSVVIILCHSYNYYYIMVFNDFRLSAHVEKCIRHCT